MIDIQHEIEHILERLTDDLLVGKPVKAHTGEIALHDILEGEFILGAELGKIWALDWHDQLQALDNLQSRARKVVEAFVDRHCVDEARERASEEDVP
jgi:hypothetical protein